MSTTTSNETIVFNPIQEINSMFVVPTHRINTPSRCSFCKCTGHNIRNCSDPDIDILHRSAQFMYLTTCRYLKRRPNAEKTHKIWLDKLSTSEYKILARLNRLDTNSRTKRNEYREKLHTYYIGYAENELRNDHSPNAMPIISIYSANLFAGIVTTEQTLRFAIYTLDNMIKQSGRTLLDMARFRIWLNNNIEFYNRLHHNEPSMVAPVVAVKKPIKINYNASLMKESHDECPICYTDMTNDTMVQLGCCHSFCGDCIIGQIKSTNKPTVDCAMCRSTISQCSSASNQLLQKISSNFA
jgi:hypothetical protein